MGLNEKFFASAAAGPPVPTADLKLYLNASDTNSYSGTGSTWYDLTANNNDGTISGATWNSSGYFDFDGSNDSVNIGSSLTFNVDSSIAVWINPDSPNGNSSILSKWSNLGWMLNQQNSGNIEFFFYSGNSFKKVNCGIPSNGSWTQFVITYDGSDLKGYINDTLSATASTNLVPNNESTNVLLSGGPITGVSTNYFNGQISKVRMYDAALTSTEITALYNEGE